MKTSQNGITLIKNFEGLRLTAYKPVITEKYWTIGYGHYGADVKKGMTITMQKAEEFLIQDLVKFENYVNNLKRSFNQNEFDALVSFCYNCGEGNLKLLCKNRTNPQIAQAILLYNKAGGKVLEGLTKRRSAERELFLKPLKEEVQVSEEKLPYKVKTKCDLNIRSGAGATYPKIRTVDKGTELTVWAIETNDKIKWGKNGKEYFCLSYCEKV